jgi:hypothetical protein
MTWPSEAMNTYVMLQRILVDEQSRYGLRLTRHPLPDDESCMLSASTRYEAILLHTHAVPAKLASALSPMLHHTSTQSRESEAVACP